METGLRGGRGCGLPVFYTGEEDAVPVGINETGMCYFGIWQEIDTEKDVCKGLVDEEQVCSGSVAQMRKYQLFVFMLYACT